MAIWCVYGREAPDGYIFNRVLPVISISFGELFENTTTP